VKKGEIETTINPSQDLLTDNLISRDIEQSGFATIIQAKIEDLSFSHIKPPIHCLRGINLPEKEPESHTF